MQFLSLPSFISSINCLILSGFAWGLYIPTSSISPVVSILSRIWVKNVGTVFFSCLHSEVKSEVNIGTAKKKMQNYGLRRQTHVHCSWLYSAFFFHFLYKCITYLIEKGQHQQIQLFAVYNWWDINYTSGVSAQMAQCEQFVHNNSNYTDKVKHL